MSANDNNTVMTSKWLIDQIVDQGEVDVTLPAFAVFPTTEVLVQTFTQFGLPFVPKCKVMLKFSGDPKWYQPGTYASVAGHQVFMDIHSDGIYLWSYDAGSVSVTARYRIYNVPIVGLPV